MIFDVTLSVMKRVVRLLTDSMGASVFLFRHASLLHERVISAYDLASSVIRVVCPIINFFNNTSLLASMFGSLCKCQSDIYVRFKHNFN